MTLRSEGKGKYSVLRNIKVERRKQPKSIKLRLQWKKEFDHDIIILLQSMQDIGEVSKTLRKKRSENSRQFVFKDQMYNG